MRARSDESLLSRLILLMWLPLAALLGLASLEDDSGEADPGGGNATTAWWSAAGAGPQTDLVSPEGQVVRPVSFESPWDEAPAALPVLTTPVSEPILHRGAYTALLRHQLLRIPDAPESART